MRHYQVSIATAKGVSGAPLWRWTAEIVGFYPYPSLCTFQLTWLIFGGRILTLEHSDLTLSTTWASRTASSQKTSCSGDMRIADLGAAFVHDASRLIRGQSYARDAVFTPPPTSSVVLSVRTVRGSRLVHTAPATASPICHPNSSTSCTKQRIDPRPVQGCPASSASVPSRASSLLPPTSISTRAPNTLSAVLASAVLRQGQRCMVSCEFDASFGAYSSTAKSGC